MGVRRIDADISIENVRVKDWLRSSDSETVPVLWPFVAEKDGTCVREKVAARLRDAVGSTVDVPRVGEPESVSDSVMVVDSG